MCRLEQSLGNELDMRGMASHPYFKINAQGHRWYCRTRGCGFIISTRGSSPFFTPSRFSLPCLHGSVFGVSVNYNTLRASGLRRLDLLYYTLKTTATTAKTDNTTPAAYCEVKTKSDGQNFPSIVWCFFSLAIFAGFSFTQPDFQVFRVERNVKWDGKWQQQNSHCVSTLIPSNHHLKYDSQSMWLLNFLFAFFINKGTTVQIIFNTSYGI